MDQQTHELWRLLEQAETDSHATQAAEQLLSVGGFHDSHTAVKRLRSLLVQGNRTEVARRCLSLLLSSLIDSPSPDVALLNFERYVSRRGTASETYFELLQRPRALEILLRIFIGSQYLTETFLRDPEGLERLAQHRELADLKSRDQFLQEALEDARTHSEQTAQLDALRRFQRWEILRIGVCDNVGLMDLRASTVQLSLLADALIQACLMLVAKTPQEAEGLLILAMGKLGGEELNYSSDIDLIFLAAENPDRYIPVAQRLVRALQTATSEGFLYRVDMRLRPWGRSGSLVCSVPSFLGYVRRDAELWERQALLKARQISGDPVLGQELLAQTCPLIFADEPSAIRSSVKSAKERIERELEKKGQQWGEVKSGSGSIRDIEFLTQYLQLIHGGRHPQLKTPNTLEGLIRLTDAGLLQADEYRHLTGGYVFLRTIEHALQLMHNKQVHRLPEDPRELTYLARRLDFTHREAFIAHYDRHCRAIRKIYDRHLGDDAVPPATPPLNSLAIPQYTPEEQELHRRLLSEVTLTHPVRVHAVLCEGPLWRVTVVGIDQPGDLSIICGLLFVYGFDILNGLVTTGWHPQAWSQMQAAGRKGTRGREAARDFVDTFTVRPPHDSAESDVWIRYESDLRDLLQLLRDGEDGEAQGRLANRVAAALEEPDRGLVRLSPVDVQVDNETDPTSTVLQIRAEDSLGFLYELSNALSLSAIDIQLVVIRSDGNRVFDTLHVTDARHGGKITDPIRVQQLQAAVVLIKHFTHLLPNAPHPEAALNHFRSFVQELFHQPNWWEEWTTLERPEVMEALARLLGVSDFLWEDVLRLQYANLFPLLRDQSQLQHRRSKEAWHKELWDLLQLEENSAATTTGLLSQRTQQLNEFKDREMFRTDMRHILGYVRAFHEFSAELTDLAEVVVECAAAVVASELQSRHGQPSDETGQICPLAICALGKCGGRELGFASDIELILIYRAEGMTNGREPLPNATYFQRFAERLTQVILARREGVFHVDLRLRPYGKSGPLATSVPAFLQYYAIEGPAWPFERQALVKFRPIAGDPDFGAELVRLRDGLIFRPASFDAAALRAMRERQVRQLVRAGTFHAKLSPGGLVDLEYLAQALQLQYGADLPDLRTPNTQAAFQALYRHGIFDDDDFKNASEAYLFFRRLIDALRMVRGDARDLTVPSSRSEEFEFLTRRLGYGGNVVRVKDEMAAHSRVITNLVRKFLPLENEH